MNTQKLKNSFAIGKSFWKESSTVQKITILVIAAAFVYMLMPAIAMAADDPGTPFMDLAKDWMANNVGKLLALGSAAGGGIGFIFTHNPRVLVYGLIGSAIIGGIVGISNMMHGIGSDAFSNYNQ